jgi:hypothetical protein
MRLTKIVLLVLVCTAGSFGVCLAIAIKLLGLGASSGPLPSVPMFSTTDTISICTMLAIATLIVTAVGVGVGVMAFWGYQKFEQELGNRAGEAARNAALEYIRGPEIQSSLQSEALRIVAAEFEKWKVSQELAAAQPPQTPSRIEPDDQNEKVGKPYRPKRGGVKGKEDA